MWLWHKKDYLSFDEGNRIEEFVSFLNEEQFAPEADRLAKRAAVEVQRIRAKFEAVTAIAKYLSWKRQKSFWDFYNAGIACGLAGYTKDAKRFFKAVIGTDDNLEWVRAACAEAQVLRTQLADSAAFRRTVEETVHATRQLLRLHALVEIDFSP
jgi:hypothetical protein